MERRRTRTWAIAVGTLVAAWLLAASGARAAAPPTVTCSSDPNIFNTGYDAATGGVLANNAKDANWTVAGPFPATSPATATSMPPAGATFAAANVGKISGAYSNSPFGNAQWISQQTVAAPSSPTGDWYYQFQFDLDPAVDPSTFSLAMNFLADNDVAEVFVNGQPQSGLTSGLPQNTTNPYNFVGYQTQNAANTTLDHNWQTGLNTITVQVKSGAPAEAFDAQVRPSVLCPVDLAVTKTASPDPYVAGQPLTWTVKVSNGGPGPAKGFTVADPLPAGFTWTCSTPAGSSCTASGAGDVNDSNTVLAAGATLTYTITGTVPGSTTGPLTNTATVTPASGTIDPGCTPSCSATATDPEAAFTVSKAQKVLDPPTAESDDQLTVEKQQEFVALGPGETKTVTVSCPAGYLVLDGSPLIQHVDQGTGTPADVEVVRSESTSPSAYTFTLHNPATGNAQAQAFVTCVQQATTGGGTLALSAPVTGTVAFDAGLAAKTLACPLGTTATDPGYSFTSGTGRVVASQPAADGTAWSFTIQGDGPGAVDLSIRCLEDTTSQGNVLITQDVVQQVSVPAGATVTAQVTCPVGYKGITASYDLPDGLRLLGDEPQPVTRVFTLQNTTSAPLVGTLDLTCLLDTTAQPPAPVPYTTAAIGAHVGETIAYEITATNTGGAPLAFDPLSDANCDAATIAGGPGDASVAPGQTTTWTCRHVVSAADLAAGTYTNVASVTGGSPGGGPSTTHDSNAVTANLSAAPPAPVHAPGTTNASPSPSSPARTSASTDAAVLGAASVTRTGRLVVTVAVPSTGSVDVAAYARVGRHTVRIAGTSRRVASAGSIRMTARMSARGRRALRRAGRLRVRFVVTLRPVGGTARTTTRTRTLAP